MSRVFVLLLALSAVAACNKPEPTSQVQAPAETVATVAEGTLCDSPTGFQYSPFPQGVNPDLALHFRHDQIRSRPDGEQRRVVAFEYLTGDQQSAMDALITAMTQAGYKAGSKRTRDDGRFEVIFRKNREQVIGTVLSNVGKKPSHPDAKGIIALNMPFYASAEIAAEDR